MTLGELLHNNTLLVIFISQITVYICNVSFKKLTTCIAGHNFESKCDKAI